MVLTIPRAQSLRFVQITSQYGVEPYTHDNRLLQNDYENGDEPIVYFQKYHTTDNINVQLITDYQTIDLKVYNCANQVVTTYQFVDQNAGLSNNLKVLQTQIVTTSLGGIYYAVISASGIGLQTLLFRSEYFEVDNYATITKIEWGKSDYSGLYYANGVKFSFRIEASIQKFISETETETFKNFNSSIVNVKTTTLRNISFETDEIPRYIYEKLSLAFAHKKVYINGIEYVGTGDSNAEPIPDTIHYFYARVITEANYENYDQYDRVTGGIEPVTGTDSISWDGTDDIITDASETILIPY